jgi:hypothetical protein
MPEIKCHAGHTMHVSTDEWIAVLTVDQMRYARDQLATKIQATEEQPKRCVWRVCSGQGWVAENYREEDFDKAADHLLRIFKEHFSKEADDFVKEPYGARRFQESIPRIEVERVSQHEYDHEWFPNTKGG